MRGLHPVGVRCAAPPDITSLHHTPATLYARTRTHSEAHSRTPPPVFVRCCVSAPSRFNDVLRLRRLRSTIMRSGALEIGLDNDDDVSIIADNDLHSGPEPAFSFPPKPPRPTSPGYPVVPLAYFFLPTHPSHHYYSFKIYRSRSPWTPRPAFPSRFPQTPRRGYVPRRPRPFPPPPPPPLVPPSSLPFPPHLRATDLALTLP